MELIEKLKECYKPNEPIFTNEIFDVMKDFSRQRIYQLISEAISSKELIRYDEGIYYMPEVTEFGMPSVPSIYEVIKKKYIESGGDSFGIYGKDTIDLNFFISTQVPDTIEVITNNESRNIREVKIRDRKVILRKARTKITNKNKYAYTLMEFFNNIDINEYKESNQVIKAVEDYIKEYKITEEQIFDLGNYFPAKAMKNIALSGLLYEIAR